MKTTTKLEGREKYTRRIEVLEKVKKLLLMKKDDCATTEQVAAFYGVSDETMNLLIEQHYDELKQSGMMPLKSKDSMLFFKRAILCVGLLLEGNEVASEVRTQMLNL